MCAAVMRSVAGGCAARSWLRARALAETDAGRAWAADAIFDQLERDFVTDDQLVERAERRVAAVEEHFTAVGVADESVTLASVNANDPAACRPAAGRERLIRFAGTRGRLGPLVHTQS